MHGSKLKGTYDLKKEQKKKTNFSIYIDESYNYEISKRRKQSEKDDNIERERKSETNFAHTHDFYNSIIFKTCGGELSCCKHKQKSQQKQRSNFLSFFCCSLINSCNKSHASKFFSSLDKISWIFLFRCKNMQTFLFLQTAKK